MSEPNISLVTILHDNIDFYPLVKHHWETFDYPKDKLEWIIVDDSKNDHSDLFPLHENILYIKIDSGEYLDKISFPKDDDKSVWNYWNQIKCVPDGFKRDYAVGLTSHDYILHIDIDTIYQPKTIRRKLSALRKSKLDCVYCKSMLCYDLYGQKVYKTDKAFGYESTLFHTKEFWKQNGFEWSSHKNEAIAFYHNKGNTRHMENYYDTIKVLSIHNMNHYQPKEVTIENLDIKIPDILNTIKVNRHPLQDELYDLLYDVKEVNILTIHSDMIDVIKEEKWNCHTLDIDPKAKEKVISKEIKKLNKTFDVCIINTKKPVWSFIQEYKFKYIILESEKNRGQMDSILKQNKYLLFNEIYILNM